MKRKAILVGNTSGLQGVAIDIARYNAFLRSKEGGEWYSNEIEVLMNPRKNDLLNTIKNAKLGNFDYVLVAFSGHGAQQRSVILEINQQGEYIFESDLSGIATRQLNIYDCCRGVIPSLVKEGFAMDSSTAALSRNTIELIRERYNQRIMQALPQNISLYACSVNEYSYDTKDGGVYSSNLVSAARNLSDEFKLVGVAHQESSENTVAYTKQNCNTIQHPEATGIPRCLSCQGLILSINTRSFI